jgi:membrane associated rhomboid family serine protease
METILQENLPEAGDPQDISREEIYTRYKPLICIIISVACFIIYLGYIIDTAEYSVEKLMHWGAPGIWDGHIWGLLTSNFLHIEFWHLIMNLYWLNKLGKKVEFESKRSFFIVLVISSGIIASIYELIIAGQTGIGLSGIVYALFGFIAIKSYFNNSYKHFLGRGLVALFITWLFFCVYLSYKNIMQIGNAAHFVGLFWGMLLAYTDSRKKRFLRIILPVVLFILSFSSLFWAHWSIGYLSYKAYDFHIKGNIKEASKMYNMVLSKDPGNEWAKENIKVIEIDSLSVLAYNAHYAENYEAAKEFYKKIIALDSTNSWAKLNLKNIPE